MESVFAHKNYKNNKQDVVGDVMSGVHHYCFSFTKGVFIMPKKIFITLCFLVIAGIVMSAPMQRSQAGWGKKITVSVAPTAVTVTQPNADPDTAWIGQGNIRNDGTGEVHIAFNVSLGTFTNMYASNICIVLESGDGFPLREVAGGLPIWKITHRTAAGAATLYVNGR